MRLGEISRSSWMIASNARVLAFDVDVLTLAFQSQNDVAGFKKLTAGAGVSEDLRTAILAVLGVRVKYLARHDMDPGNDSPPPGDVPPPFDDAPPPADHAAAPARSAAPAYAAAPPHPGRPSGTSASGAAPAARPAPESRAAPAARPAPASGHAPAPRPAPAATSVTEWAVATIPTGGDSAPSAFTQLAVDDEPEEAAIATLTQASPAPVTGERPVEGDVLGRELTDDDAPDLDEEPDIDTLGPATTSAPAPTPRSSPTMSTRSSGVQRVGEAVVRQVLGATFVREEPYEPPTRFN